MESPSTTGHFCSVSPPASRLVRGQIVAFILLCSLPGGAVAQGEVELPVFDLATGVRYHSNLSNAVPSGDRKSDTFWQAATGATWSYRPQRDWTLYLRPEVQVAVASRYEAFSHGGAGLDAGIAYKAGLGHLAPRFELGLATEYQVFNEDDLSGMSVEPTLRYSQRLNDFFGWELSYNYDSHYARGDVNDGDGHTGGLVLRYEPGGPWAFLMGYQMRSGDVVSYATPPQPGILGEADLASPGFTGFGQPMTAYRLDALAHALQVGTAYAVSDHVSLECLYEWRTTQKSNLDYDAHFIQFGLRASF
jgi:hypothetical protein